MSTRSRLAMETPNGAVYSIYCHSDGYPEHQAPILLEHYSDEKRVRALIELGNLSELGPRLDPAGAHGFDYSEREPGVCVAYARDRGDEDQAAHINDTVDALTAWLAESWEEWAYLWRAGQWYCTPIGGAAGPGLVDARDPEGIDTLEWLPAADWLAIERGDRERPKRGAAYAFGGAPVSVPVFVATAKPGGAVQLDLGLRGSAR